jgi:hypothetical protein
MKDMKDMKDGEAICCLGCGAATGARWPETPVPNHCGKCPPEVCDQCGQPDSAAKPCACWTPLEGMAHADIKAIFAASDLGLAPPGV